MFYSSPTSTITPALVSVAMSRSDSRDSDYSTASDRSYNFTYAPLTVSYSSSPSCHNLGRTTSNTSATCSASRRASSQTMSRRDSASTWLSSPYRSCQQQAYEEPSSYLSDDDLLFIAPATSQPQSHEMPLNSFSAASFHHQKELTTEEQIAMMREMRDKEQDEMIQLQQQRRQQQAAAAQKAVRFADQKTRRPSYPRRRSPVVRKGMSQLNGPQ